MDFHGKRATVAGLGHFGGQVAVARWLVAQGAHVLVTDKLPAEKLAASVSQLQDLPITASDSRPLVLSRARSVPQLSEDELDRTPMASSRS